MLEGRRPTYDEESKGVTNGCVEVDNLCDVSSSFFILIIFNNGFLFNEILLLKTARLKT